LPKSGRTELCSVLAADCFKLRLKLQERGVLKKYNVAVLGSPVKSIELTEDRQMFADHLRAINIPVPPSGTATTFAQAKSMRKNRFPLWCARLLLWAGKRAAWLTTKRIKRNSGRSFGVSPQVLIENISSISKKLNMKSCGTSLIIA